MKFLITVTQEVEVTLDETKFDEQALEDFRKSFYNFEDIEDHAKHLGQLLARGLISPFEFDPFVEGYGPLSSMGISLKHISTEEEAREIE